MLDILAIQAVCVSGIQAVDLVQSSKLTIVSDIDMIVTPKPDSAVRIVHHGDEWSYLSTQLYIYYEEVTQQTYKFHLQYIIYLAMSSYLHPYGISV